MFDLAKILAKIQKEMSKLIAPTATKTSNLQDLEDFDSVAENVFIAPTSTPIKTKTAVSNNIQLASRNFHCTMALNFSRTKENITTSLSSSRSTNT